MRFEQFSARGTSIIGFAAMLLMLAVSGCANRAELPTGERGVDAIPRTGNESAASLPASGIVSAGIDVEGGLRLPGDGVPGGWTAGETHSVYEGEDLFLYINGGAELYHEYGFEMAVTQSYSDENGRSVTLELFEMHDDAGAFGLFSMKRDRGAESLALGNGGAFEGYYINFWKGRVVATVTALFDDHETGIVLKELARAAGDLLPEGGEMPFPASLLPEKDLDRSSIRYLVGGLGLMNTASWWPRDALNFTEAIFGRYRSGIDVLVFVFQREADCRWQYESAGSHLRTLDGYGPFKTEKSARHGLSDRARGENDASPRFSVRAVDGTMLIAAVAGRHLVVAHGDDEKGTVEEIFRSVIDTIESVYRSTERVTPPEFSSRIQHRPVNNRFEPCGLFLSGR